MHKKLISSVLLGSILMTPIYAYANPNLKDISGHWAKKEINQFISSGYVNGYEDGTFRPDNSITRSEFVKLVNKYFGFNNKEDVKFSDINTNDWYYNDICIASKAGYINGYEDKTFKPNKTITREEVSKILISIKNKQDNIYDKLNKYPDKNKVSNWAKPYVEGAIEQGYLKGNDLGLLNPTNNITRAESVTILSRVSKEKSEIKDETKNEAPVITATEDLILEVGQKFDTSMLNVKVSDKEDKNLDVKYEGKVNTDLAGNYTITITAKDSKGLTTTKKVTVVVKAKPEIKKEVKNEAPVITATENLTLEVGQKFDTSMLNVKVSDKEDKNLDVKYEGKVNTDLAGNYTITVTAKDSKGLTTTKKITVVVKEKPEIKKEVKNEAPVITATENLILEVGQKFDTSMLNVKVSDKEDKNLDVKYEGKVNTDLAGNYTITITARDSKELTTTKKVNVVVKAKPEIKKEIKNEAPVITATEILTLDQGDSFEYGELNAQAKDTEGKDISKYIVYSGKVNICKEGEYPIVLTVKDKKGISNSLKVKVIVNSKNKLILQKILDDKTSNVKVHKDDHGAVESYDVFSKGVTPPSDDDYTIFSAFGYITPITPYKPGMGWYDANKVFNKSGDDYLCSGATAANMLNWWMDQNADYINRYLDLHGENSTCINKEFGISQNATISNFRKNPDDLFRYITKCFGNPNKKGIHAGYAMFWFLNGHDLNCSLSSNKIDDRGGFFPDVFHNYHSITSQKGCVYFEQLNYLLLNNLYNNKGIGLSYNTSIGSHIVSLWGAKFDTNGNLLGVFITDSNDGKKLIDNKSGNTYGMIYRNIVKEVKTGAPKITNKVTPNGDVGSTVLGLQTLDTGKSIWENYFKSINSKS
ncbi:IdeS/Mac family cysteine endopeptidase [Paraclostridium sordellii]|uniref:IdeS/Mac family cysteine endopeptidase n=1 Tax=Paraclostridium sordellii TaxID=1505 RepID=UPI0005E0063E|nr:IdeS/Mac family cysteine endopeptidase [Paeniclostridium sordellii]CEN83265.1 putative S-layer protein [[Clostridium] sordellii] [Paeniclostridium sordellii]